MYRTNPECVQHTGVAGLEDVPSHIRQATTARISTGIGSAMGPIESVGLGALSQSTGSVILDGLIGGTAAYWLAPKGAKTRYAVGGAVATGLGGALGLVATLGFIWATSRDRGRR
jgi:hypothetical protein